MKEDRKSGSCKPWTEKKTSFHLKKPNLVDLFSIRQTSIINSVVVFRHLISHWRGWGMMRRLPICAFNNTLGSKVAIITEIITIATLDGFAEFQSTSSPTTHKCSIWKISPNRLFSAVDESLIVVSTTSWRHIEEKMSLEDFGFSRWLYSRLY